MSNVAIFDQQRAESFGAQLLTALNPGALCLMISVGHRTGLFDAMRDTLPATSRDIAERTGLNARYVREWLGALLTAGVVEFEPVTKQFFLPTEHAGYLTRVAGADNIGVGRRENAQVPRSRRLSIGGKARACARSAEQLVCSQEVRESRGNSRVQCPSGFSPWENQSPARAQFRRPIVRNNCASR